MNIDNFYIVCNKLQPHDYIFKPLLVNTNMSDGDFIKFCENIYKYIKQPVTIKKELYTVHDISLNTTYENCYNIVNVKGRIPFFIWGKSVINKIDTDMISRFNELNNSLFLDDESLDISNPYVINELVIEYFQTGKILDKKVNTKPVFILKKYNFGNDQINNIYNYDFEISRQQISNDYNINIKTIDVFDSDILKNIPSFENKYNGELKYHVYAICYNESRLLPHFLNHYRDADKIYVLDNYSTDNSCDIITKAGRDVIKYNSDKTINEAVYKHIKNNIWKLSRGKVDYVIVQDLDEFLYFPDYNNVGEGIQYLKSQNINLLTPHGYNICFKEKELNEALHLQLNKSFGSIIDYTVKGYRNTRYDKCIIFNPNKIQEINYKEGAHEFSPYPYMTIPDNIKCFLLHYKHIGEQYEMKRKMFIRDRMSKENMVRGFATEYFKSDKDIILEVKDIHKNAVNIYDIIHTRPKITCNIRGGLGNQLFMIAATLAYAWRNNIHPIFRRKMELSHNPHGYWNDILNILPYNDELDTSNFDKIEENGNFIYEPIKTNFKDTVLTGYYQSINYFREYEHEIRKMFLFFINTPIIDRKDTYKELITNISKYIESIHNENKLVGIFIRRGDYVSLDSYSGKWLLPVEYYKTAMDEFRKDERYKDCKFVIFSKDKEWCKEQFPNLFVHDCEHDVVQFYLLSKMDGWILANSTFSWWAEFLGNPDKTKKVIAPFPWLKNHNYNSEIYRDYWQKINW